MRGRWAHELVASATRARALLSPDDPLSDLLARFVARVGRGDRWTDLAVAIAMIEPLIDRLRTWPPPASTPDEHPFPPPCACECDEAALSRIDALRWLSAMAALQALELGQGTPMARALAVGAIALWEGDSDGVGWMTAAVRLSGSDPS
jgi:hypothetical protein